MLYSDDGSVADRDALASWIRRAERRAGLAVTGRLHILRHTFCSRLAMRGATAKPIQELAGHVSLSTTERYMHLSPTAKENAIRMLDGGGSAWESNPKDLNKRNQATTHANSSFRLSDQRVGPVPDVRASPPESTQTRPGFGDSLETAPEAVADLTGPRVGLD